jgi:cytochrome c peroxidase
MPLHLKIALSVAGLILGVFSLTFPEGARSQQSTDAIAQAQTPKEVPIGRPEQKKTAHDLSEVFNPINAEPSSEALTNQIDRGEMRGFDFYRDGLGATRPGMTFDDFYRAGVANKAGVMATQRRLLESRYNLEPKLDPVVTMSRGKPLPVGPTAKLPAGMTWEALAALGPDEIRVRDIFPYKALPHASQGGGLGGQVFPQMQTRMFPRLERYDVEFDLPEAFLPEFPPAMYLQSRPELGDVSRGEVVSINNYYRLFVDILTAVQLDGLRLLVTPFPQEEFNPTGDRKTAQPSLGVTCFDCHTNGHTSGAFHITPDQRPEQRRIRLDTVSLRGMFNQQIHGSKRSLRSVEDFTEFEQRSAYFNGDMIHALKKGMNILDRIQVTNMAQMQNMLDFPPAPKLTLTGRLDPTKATAAELAGEKLFFGKAQCSSCHPAPMYLDNQMHDLHVERFLKNEAGDGPIKAFTLRGIKDSPPYFHDGRLLTLEDTVEFFNLVLELKLTPEEKRNLVEFMRQL